VLTPRKSVALLCAAAILLVAMVPVAAIVFSAALIALGGVTLLVQTAAVPCAVAHDDVRPPALFALVTSGYAPRASLPAARS
jgi:hypothetical protein